MASSVIRILGLNDLNEFLEQASKVDGDVLVNRGKFTVDGKSFVGLMSVDLTESVKVSYPETALDFKNYLKKFEVA